MSVAKLDFNDRLLTSGEVAKRLTVSQGWCEYHRRTGGGPPFHILGTRTVRYLESELNAWIESQKKVNSYKAHSMDGVSYE